MKIIIFAVVIIAALVAGVYLTKSYFDHSAAAVPLKSQIETDTKNLQIMKSTNLSLVADTDSLKAKQVQIQQAITEESAVIPTRLNPNEIISNILDAGKQCGVTIMPLSATDWTTTKIAKGDYWVFKATMDVNGTQTDLINFLKYIQDSISQYLVIEHLDISQISPIPSPTATPPPEEILTPSGLVTANLGVAVYAR